VRVYVILDERSSATNPLGDAVETFIRREDAERFIEEVRGDDPELAGDLRIEEREFEAGGAELDAALPMGHFRFCRCQYHHMHHASRAQTGQEHHRMGPHGPGARLIDEVPGQPKPQDGPLKNPASLTR
jgi:hypothetical protein